nr:hypothetical protein [uncultured Anaerotignum sp.]
MKKRNLFCIGALLGSLLIPSIAVGEEALVWKENNPSIYVYDTDFKGCYMVDFLNTNADGYETYLDDTIVDAVYLWMVNGGFVPKPDILCSRDGTMYLSIEALEPLGMKATATKETVTISNQTHSLRLQKNDDFITINKKIYVPLRVVAEQFGGKVEYLKDYKQTLCHSQTPNFYPIHLISVETAPQEKKYNAQEKMEELNRLSAIEHAQTCRTQKDRGESAEIAPFSIRDTGKTFGRYDIYEVEHFEAFPIFVNRCTGEIYSENPWSPIVAIAKGFPDLSAIY